MYRKNPINETFLSFIIIVCLIVILIISFIQITKKEENAEESTESSSLMIIEMDEIKEPEPIEQVRLISLGEFKLTAYCSCEKCCGKWALNRPLDENGNEIIYGASGERLSANLSIAVDPTVIPYGTEVVINGHTYIAHDTGGAIKGNRIDIYFDSHEDAWNFGLQYAEVFIKEIN